MIPFLDVKAAWDELRDELTAAQTRVMQSGWYIGGPEVETFEADFARYCQAGHAVGVGNGLDALRLTLLAMGVGPGDEVIVPSHTFIATWLGVSQVGATLVPVEPAPGGFNMDPSRIAAALTPRTKVILPVHLYGQPADLAPILELARTHGVKVIEDAAQAHGATYQGRRIGAHGDAVTWSFYPGKNLGAFGDGGAVTTDDAALAERVRMLSNYGSLQKYDHQLAGTNSRLDPVQAALLGVKLQHLDAWNDRRRQVAARYARGFADLPIDLPDVLAGTEPVWHLYVIRSPQRDALAEYLSQHGVQTVLHYPKACFDQPAYADLSPYEANCPQARSLAQTVLSLPIGPHLTETQTDQVIKAVRSFFNATRLSPKV